MATKVAFLIAVSLLSTHIQAQQISNSHVIPTLTVTVTGANHNVHVPGIGATINPQGISASSQASSTLSSCHLTTIIPDTAHASIATNALLSDRKRSPILAASADAITDAPSSNTTGSAVAAVQTICICAGGQHASAITTTINGRANVICDNKPLSPSKGETTLTSPAEGLQNLEDIMSEVGMVIASAASRWQFNGTATYDNSATGVARNDSLPAWMTAPPSNSSSVLATTSSTISLITASGSPTQSGDPLATTSTASLAAAAPSKVGWTAACGLVGLSGFAAFLA